MAARFTCGRTRPAVAASEQSRSRRTRRLQIASSISCMRRKGCSSSRPRGSSSPTSSSSSSHTRPFPWGHPQSLKPLRLWSGNGLPAGERRLARPSLRPSRAVRGSADRRLGPAVRDHVREASLRPSFPHLEASPEPPFSAPRLASGSKTNEHETTVDRAFHHSAGSSCTHTGRTRPGAPRRVLVSCVF